ncbi:MAG: sulfurtransferase TusA family protein [Candidatus Poseidoniaceae archaeon]|nr:sulfurtransferase TusA family protein [Candidatus Poseidoniaceae archaeon]
MPEVVAMGDGAKAVPDRTLNVLGFLCPIPIAKTREVMLTMNESDILEMWSDDPETVQDIPELVNRHDAELLSIESDSGEFRFMIKVGGPNE